jgi:NADH:ubiquinone oxidoreductase subunit H
MFINISSFIVVFFVLVVFVMVGVALLTLLERRVLECIYVRSGPFRVGFLSIFQPFSDARRKILNGRTINEMSGTLKRDVAGCCRW